MMLTSRIDISRTGMKLIMMMLWMWLKMILKILMLMRRGQSLNFLMVLYMLGSGTKRYVMVMECKYGLMELYMKVCG